MTRLTGGTALRVAAWMVAITVSVLLWLLIKRLDYAIYCWPLSPGSDSWGMARSLALSAMLPAIAVPAAATIFSNRRPSAASALAVATIVLLPILCIALYRWAPPSPR